MGLFDRIKVVTLITEAARSSEPFFMLGKGLQAHAEGGRNVPLDLMVPVATQVEQFHYSFHQYFVLGDKKYKTDAIKFLVICVAYHEGRLQGGQDWGRGNWDWEQIRKTSHALYLDMEESPSNFRSRNVPLIESILKDIIKLGAALQED